MPFLQFFSAILIVALFIFSKVNSYENKISIKYKKAYSIIKSILNPILGFLKTLFKPFQIGENLFIDTSQIILLILLMIILKA